MWVRDIPSLDVAADQPGQEWTVKSEEDEADRYDRAMKVSKPVGVGADDRCKERPEREGSENWVRRYPPRPSVWWPTHGTSVARPCPNASRREPH